MALGRDIIKTPLDVLKIKEYSERDVFKNLQRRTIDSLYKDLNNTCAMCGFRTKLYDKYVEHLDIHFHINYIKRNSTKKVFCRKEGISKSDWMDNTPSTINSVLYYQNDPDMLLNSNLLAKNMTNNEENIGSIFPVQKRELKCVYCGEEFKKKYIEKYHYWFYLNVLKFEMDDFTNYKDILKLMDVDDKEYFLIHDSCKEDFLNVISHRESLTKLLGRKRDMNFSFN
jgi:hypothetical protein